MLIASITALSRFGMQLFINGFAAGVLQALLPCLFQRNRKSYPQARRFFIQRIVDKCGRV